VLLDLLAAGEEPDAFASQLEETAETFEDDEAKARFYLLAAEAWALRAGDAVGARAALSQAGALGLDPSLVARVGRALALLAGDATWYEDTSRRVLASGVEEEERISLALDLARVRAARGDFPSLLQALEQCGSEGAGQWLAQSLLAFALPVFLEATPEDQRDAVKRASTEALLSLADADPLPARGRLLRAMAAWRLMRQGHRPEALELLNQLHEAEPTELLPAIALSTARRAEGDTLGAARILVEVAAHLQDTELATGLLLEAALTLWRAEAHQEALHALEAASDLDPDAAGALLAWLRRSLPAQSVTERSALLEEGGLDLRLDALDGFALNARPQGDPDAAQRFLERLGDDDDALGTAGLLARAAWSSRSDTAGRLDALERLSQRVPGAETISAMARHQVLLRDQASPGELMASARVWAELDSDCVPAALEWLSAAVAEGNEEEALLAREDLATRLPVASGAPLAAEVAILRALRQEAIAPIRSAEPALRLAALELSPPTADTARRAAALHGVGDLLGGASQIASITLAGLQHLAQGQPSDAMQAFRSALELEPRDLAAWDGLREAASLAEDDAALAESLAALGDLVPVDTEGAELWEQAAFILLDRLKDEANGELALSRAVARDVRRARAFDRLFRIVRARKDTERLLELIHARLEVTEDISEIVKLHWERARTLREAGRRDESLQALEDVMTLEPDHVGALALLGEVYIAQERFAEAADALARLARHEGAPPKQRLMSGVAAVDLYENRLADAATALSVLADLHRHGLSTLAVRERMARVAAKAQSWNEAVQVLELLMLEREQRAGKVEAARLALVIHRDRRQRPADALGAAKAILKELPSDGEAIDLLISGALPVKSVEPLLPGLQQALVDRLQRDPLDPEQIDRLSRVAIYGANLPLRQATLGALVAIGAGNVAIDEELAALDGRIQSIPSMSLDPATFPDIIDPGDGGAMARFFQELAEGLVEAVGPNLEGLGVTKKQRVDARSGHPLRTEVGSWAGALGLGDFELYVGGPEPKGLVALPTSPVAVVIGAEVTLPLKPWYRQRLARELFAAARGTSLLRHRDSGDAAALVVAACKLAGTPVDAPPYALVAEFERMLSKDLGRKWRKALPELAAGIANEGVSPATWVEAAVGSLDRVAALAAGDASLVLADDPTLRGRPSSTQQAQRRLRRLLGFVLSPSYLALRDRLGMVVS